MAKLAQVIEDGRVSAIFMTELVEHVRRVQAAHVASEQLQRVTGEGKRGRRGAAWP